MLTQSARRFFRRIMNSNKDIIELGNTDEYSLIYNGRYFIGKLSDKNNRKYFYIDGEYGCREEFMSWYLRDLKTNVETTFLLSVQHFIYSEYCNFIDILEKKLGISGSIVVQETDVKNVAALTVNSWWLKSKIRQEFLTIALRAYAQWKILEHQKGRTNEQENLDLEEILFSEPYFNGTKDAVKYFLAGNTLMKTGYEANKGWYTRFSANKITKNLNSWERSLVDEGYDERKRLEAEQAKLDGVGNGEQLAPI